MGHLLEPGSFFGITTSNRVVAGIVVTEGRYDPGAAIPRHAHRFPYFCVVLGGGFEEATKGGLDTCRPGTVVYHPADEEHADRMGPAGARCFNLQLGPTLTEQLAEDRLLPRSRATLPAGRATALGISLRPRGGTEPALTAMFVEDTVLALLAELAGPNGKESCQDRIPRWLDGALQRLREPHPPSVAELAAEAGVHPVYFARAFRDAFRVPPSRYAVDVRLERASAELIASRASLSAIAHTAGFSDHSHFCRQFRRRFGMTPSAYRSAFR
jgi:AraC family transcriptional regulator